MPEDPSQGDKLSLKGHAGRDREETGGLELENVGQGVGAWPTVGSRAMSYGAECRVCAPCDRASGGQAGAWGLSPELGSHMCMPCSLHTWACALSSEPADFHLACPTPVSSVVSPTSGQRFLGNVVQASVILCFSVGLHGGPGPGVGEGFFWDCLDLGDGSQDSTYPLGWREEDKFTQVSGAL